MTTTLYRPAESHNRDAAFFARMAVAIAVFVLFAFAQWSARGFVDFARVPLWVHLHALVMVGWLALFAMQARLASHGNLALHRRLGRLGAGLIVLAPLIACYAAFRSVELHRVPPFFTNGYFLVLSVTDAAAFALAAGAAIVLRRHTEWHRRLLLVATVMLMEPAFGRLLPMPLMGLWGPIAQRALQAAVVVIAMRHDRRERGSVHPALWWGLALLLVTHLALEGAGRAPAVTAYADALAAGASHP